ncbi:MAG: universal stress protein [Thermoleophilia bacterium]
MTHLTARGAVVCGVDASGAARAAIRVAGRLAESLDLRLVLVHAGRELALRHPPPIGVEYPEEDLRAVRDDAAAAGRALLDDQARASGVRDYEALVELGPPSQIVLDAARDAQAEMIVVGTRRLGVIASALVGSVSGDVLSHADCPVVVVPGDCADHVS